MSRKLRRGESSPHDNSWVTAQQRWSRLPSQKISFACITFLCWLNPILSTSAQIIPDETLGDESSNVNFNDGNPLIDRGATRGNNLFHSFQEFNINTGQEAHFASPDGIENIFSRVTGLNPSRIFGTLGVRGDANLFFLNPNGIVFGPNARLDLNGSFVASTADSLVFDNGFEFSSANPQAPPLLTVNIPMGLRFRESPGSINTDEETINSFIGPFSQLPRLQVKPGQTLALLGGEVSIERMNLSAAGASIRVGEQIEVGGRIELGSVGGESFVDLNATTPQGFAFGYDNVDNFRNIHLVGAEVNARGVGGGSIQIQGQEVSLTEGSFVSNSTFGSRDAGNLAVKASGVLTIDNSQLVSQVAESEATGNGGTVEIQAERLVLRNGAEVSTGTFSSPNNLQEVPGDGGLLEVFATESVELTGSSVLTTSTAGKGAAGDVTIHTRLLRVMGGSEISAATFSEGRGGNLIIHASESVTLTGFTTIDEELLPSGLFASSLEDSTGTAGNLTINTERLWVQNGARVETSTFGLDTPGSLTINAREIQLTGSVRGSDGEEFESGLFSRIRQGSTSSGRGGNLMIEDATLLRMTNGAIISNSTLGEGSIGTLSVSAGEVFLSDSQIVSQVLLPEARGNGGTVKIQADRLVLRNGAEVSTATLSEPDNLQDAPGNGGFLEVFATESVELTGNSALIASTNGRGRAGDITIHTRNLTVLDGSEVGAATFSEGDGGNLTIRAFESVTLGGQNEDGTVPSSLFVGSFVGRGNSGNAIVRTGQLIVRDGAEISTTSTSIEKTGLGAAGNIDIHADDLFLEGGTLGSETGSGDRGSISIESDNVVLRDRSQITTNATGDASGGNITIDTLNLVGFPRQNNDITTNGSQGGRIEINTQGLLFEFDARLRNQLIVELTRQDPTFNEDRLNQDSPRDLPSNDITAVAVGSPDPELSGEILINSPEIDPSRGLVELEELVDPADLIAQNPCNPRQRSQGEFYNTRRGGVVLSPHQVLQDDRVEVDLVDPVDEVPRTQAGSPSDSNPEIEEMAVDDILPAQNWERTPDGKVRLVGGTTDIIAPQRQQSEQLTCPSP